MPFPSNPIVLYDSDSDEEQSLAVPSPTVSSISSPAPLEPHVSDDGNAIEMEKDEDSSENSYDPVTDKEPETDEEPEDGEASQIDYEAIPTQDSPPIHTIQYTTNTCWC
ncbi:hypothetical protein L1987_54746 [Smallanthus sonchifolius]|uniref:Uncharacterized protein n=1 Tax=Smallanthus sonchifolius TaxID=185202 RepID=A0ACB9E7V6_9ASTR|nr:hypothetical protein L1987_54746 [Smallanthus sonchifolius]